MGSDGMTSEWEGLKGPSIRLAYAGNMVRTRFHPTFVSDGSDPVEASRGDGR